MAEGEVEVVGAGEDEVVGVRGGEGGEAGGVGGGDLCDVWRDIRGEAVGGEVDPGDGVGVEGGDGVNEGAADVACAPDPERGEGGEAFGDPAVAQGGGVAGGWGAGWL